MPLILHWDVINDVNKKIIESEPNCMNMMVLLILLWQT